jgi:mannosyltransferase
LDCSQSAVNSSPDIGQRSVCPDNEQQIELSWRSAISILAPILLIAAVVRLAQFDDSLWLDELHTAWTIQAGSPSDFVARAAMGNTSPLYFVLPWSTTALLGMHEFALRLPSLLAGLLLVATVFACVASWTRSTSSAVVAALLVSLDRNCIFYAQEARTYALVQLLAVLHVSLFLRTLEHPTRRLRCAGIVVAVLLFYLHFTAALLLLAEAVAYLLLCMHPRWRPRYRLAQAVGDAALIAASWLPALPLLSDVAARRGDWAMFVVRPNFAALLTRLPWLPYLALPAGGWLWVRCGRKSHAATSGDRVPIVLACWLIVPVLTAWTLAATDVARFFLVRYLAVSIVAPMALAGWFLDAWPAGWLRRLASCATIATAVATSGMLTQWRYDGRLLNDRDQDWRGAVAAINAAEPDGRLPVFVRSGFIEARQLAVPPIDPRRAALLHDFCLSPVTTVYRLERDQSLLLPLASPPLPLSPRGEQHLRDAGDGWFVLVGSPTAANDFADALCRSLARRNLSATVNEIHSFGSVHVLHIATHSGIAGA